MSYTQPSKVPPKKKTSTPTPSPPTSQPIPAHHARRWVAVESALDCDSAFVVGVSHCHALQMHRPKLPGKTSTAKWWCRLVVPREQCTLLPALSPSPAAPAGIFLALMYRFDCAQSRKRAESTVRKTYFHSCFVAYILGLVVCIGIMQVFKAAQVRCTASP